MWKLIVLRLLAARISILVMDFDDSHFIPSDASPSPNSAGNSDFIVEVDSSEVAGHKNIYLNAEPSQFPAVPSNQRLHRGH